MSKQTNILPKHASFRTLCYRGFCVFCLLLERFGKISFKNGLCRLFCGIALAAVFDDDRHGNLRVLVRRKADERQVIGMVGVFRRAGLARNGNAEISVHTCRMPSRTTLKYSSSISAFNTTSGSAVSFSTARS